MCAEAARRPCSRSPSTGASRSAAARRSRRQIIPVAIVAPLYIRGEVEFGTVTQAAMAFSHALGAFSLIVTQFQQISNYAAVVNRLGELWEATEPPAPVRVPFYAAQYAAWLALAAAGIAAVAFLVRRLTRSR